MPHGERCVPFAVFDEAADTPAELGRDDHFRRRRLCPSDPSRPRIGCGGIPALPAMRSDRIGTGDESLPGSLDGSMPHRPSGFPIFPAALRQSENMAIINSERSARRTNRAHRSFSCRAGVASRRVWIAGHRKRHGKTADLPQWGYFKSFRVFVIFPGYSVFSTNSEN